MAASTSLGEMVGTSASEKDWTGMRILAKFMEATMEMVMVMAMATTMKVKKITILQRLMISS